MQFDSATSFQESPSHLALEPGRRRMLRCQVLWEAQGLVIGILSGQRSDSPAGPLRSPQCWNSPAPSHAWLGSLGGLRGRQAGAAEAKQVSTAQRGEANTPADAA